MMRIISDLQLLYSLRIQVLNLSPLEVMHGVMRPGVAVILRDLISVMDQLNLEHPDESSLRRVLRQRKDVVTAANQRFLVATSGAEKITKNNSHHYSCVIIPREDVPQTFFDKLEEQPCKRQHFMINCIRYAGICNSTARVEDQESAQNHDNEETHVFPSTSFSTPKKQSPKR